MHVCQLSEMMFALQRMSGEESERLSRFRMLSTVVYEEQTLKREAFRTCYVERQRKVALATGREADTGVACSVTVFSLRRCRGC